MGQFFYKAACYFSDWERRCLNESFESLLNWRRQVTGCCFAFDALIEFDMFYDL